MADLERVKIKVGFIPIIDCAAIVLAEELGLVGVVGVIALFVALVWRARRRQPPAAKPHT